VSRQTLLTMFQNSPPALKIYSLCYIYYRFSAVVNFGTQPSSENFWY